MPIYTEDYQNSDDIADYTEIKAIVKSILVTRSQNGATIQEIKNDYYSFIGEQFPHIENMTEFLLSLPGIVCYTDHNCTRIFNIHHLEKSQHILDMVKKQKPSKNTTKTRSMQNLALDEQQYQHHHHNRQEFVYPPTSESENMCFFEDNYNYLKSKIGLTPADNRTRSKTTSLAYSPSTGYETYFTDNIDYDAHLYDYQLLGDDFFLSMAKMELKCRFVPNQRILQSGLCVSGQTIKEATKRVYNIPSYTINKKIIVNIGSVDILHGHELIDIQHDFINLMNAFNARGIQPIITTLAPLANYAHQPSIRSIVERFNDFIRAHNYYWKVIDLWPCMVKQNGQILFECYQNGPKYVTGSNQPHLFWNKLGRQRILKEIKKNITLC